MGNCVADAQSIAEQRRRVQRAEHLRNRMAILTILPSIKNFFKKEVKFSDKYTCTEKLLGKGGEGIVVEGYFNKKVKMKVAVKIIDRSKTSNKTGSAAFDPTRLKMEVMILSKLKHKNIMMLYDYFESESVYIIVTELVPGGTLLERLAEKKKYTERDARDIITKLLGAVSYMHRNNIVHRDLKPDNLLMTSVQEDFDFKLCDFGIATVCHGDTLTDPIGSINFVAPEVIKKVPYGKAVDVWAIGCIMFFLLSGELPFDHTNRQQIFDNILNAKYSFQANEWRGMSAAAKDLMSKILVIDVWKRITIPNILQHPWINCDGNLLLQSLDESQYKIRSRCPSEIGSNSSKSQYSRSQFSIYSAILKMEDNEGKENESKSRRSSWRSTTTEGIMLKLDGSENCKDNIEVWSRKSSFQSSVTDGRAERKDSFCSSTNVSILDERDHWDYIAPV